MEIDSRYLVVLILVAFSMAVIFLFILDMKERERRQKLQFRTSEHEDLSSRIESYKKEITSLMAEIQEKYQMGESLEELAERCDEYRSKTMTGILSVDVLLSYKERLCTERDISINYEIAEIERPLIEEKEYLSLFGNLIDNAIEAVEKCDIKDISVKAKLIKGNWVLKVVNTKLEKEHPIESGMATTKPDAINHGIGSIVIDRIARRYKGNVKRFDRGNSFEAIVTIPDIKQR